MTLTVKVSKSVTLLKTTAYNTFRGILLYVLILSGPAALCQVPVANFTANTQAGCSPLVVNFQDQSTNNPTSWNWNFGNGNTSTLQNPTATYLRQALIRLA